MHISAYLPGSSLCCNPWVVLGVVCIVCGRCRNADLLEMSGCDRWLFEICAQAISLREQLHTPPLPCSTGGLAGVDLHWPTAERPTLHSALLIGSLIVFNLASPGMLWAHAGEIELRFSNLIQIFERGEKIS